MAMNVVYIDLDLPKNLAMTEAKTRAYQDNPLDFWRGNYVRVVQEESREDYSARRRAWEGVW